MFYWNQQQGVAQELKIWGLESSLYFAAWSLVIPASNEHKDSEGMELIEPIYHVYSIVI